MKKQFLFIVLTIWSFGFLITSSALAQYTYQYNGHKDYSELVIDKFVGKPEGSSINYVDNLGTSDYKFSPGQDIYFQLKAKNASDHALNDVTIKDYIPTYLEPIEGPGEYDSANRVIIIKNQNFNISEEKNYILKMRVFSQDKLPADKGLICENNKSTIQKDNIYDEDFAHFCFEKTVSLTSSSNTTFSNSSTNSPVYPKAGPENNILLTTFASIVGYIGYRLRKVK